MSATGGFIVLALLLLVSVLAGPSVLVPGALFAGPLAVLGALVYAVAG